MLRAKELRKIREDISNTSRPTWQSRLPRDFGSPSHGKLKADVWRTCIEFDLPVSLADLWSGNDDNGDTSSMAAREKTVMESTMFLSMAIRWGTSYRTSAVHARSYKQHMHAYLKTLLKLFPNRQLHPIHHNAIHFAECLLAFGPCHGWWMFPFERLIGMLQRINTNSRIGECP